MQRTLIIIIGVILLSACSNGSLPEDKKFKQGIFLESDLAFIEINKGTQIKMGMKKDEVDALLGQPISTIDFLGIFEYPGLKIHFKNDQVNGLLIDDNTSNNDKFMTPRGIKFGDNQEQVITKYGETAHRSENTNYSILTYFIEKNDGKFTVINSFNEATNIENTYSLSMNIYKDTGLTFLMIADYAFSTNPTGK